MEHTTHAIHAPQVSAEDMHSEFMAMTSAYDFMSAEEASARFLGEKPGNVYSRFTNPTVEMFERRLAAMEGAEAAVGVASGMAAYLAIAMTYLKQGDHVLLASGIFGTTTHLFRKYFGQFGITATSVPVDDMAEWEENVQPNTKLFVVESPTNPMLAVADLSALAQLAKKHKAMFIVDNTLLSPVFQKPLEFGADIVLHSAGKWMDGQGRCVGGALVGSSELIKPLKDYLRASGVCMSPFNAWIFSKGLETLEARLNWHQRGAEKIFQWLKNHDQVTDIYCTLDTEHPNAAVIRRQQTGHCPIISFRIKGDKRAAWNFVNALKVVSRCTNIGDAKTMITHPASTTHCRYTDEEKQKHGLTDNLLRICVGLEDPFDIMADMAQAFQLVGDSAVPNSKAEYFSI